MLHPNKIHPERYRVLEKALGINQYFSFKKFGRDRAKKEADAYQQKLEKRLKAKKLSAQLPLNKIFNRDGSIKGVKRVFREREARNSYESLSIQITTAPRVQRSTEILITSDGFLAAYKKMQNTLLGLHGIESTTEIRLMFEKTRRLYRESVKPTR